MKTHNLLLLALIIFAGPLYTADYYITGQYAVEDRVAGDFDANDSVFSLKAIFQQTGNVNINEMTVIVTPMAYGAEDDLEVRLDVTRFNGTCSNPTIVQGKLCIDSGFTWTPSSGDYFLHTKTKVIDLELGEDGIANSGDEFIIYKNSSEMFANCAKTKLINTLSQAVDCDGQPRVLTLIDTDLTWGNGNFGPEAIECTNPANCAASSTEVSSEFDFSQFLDLRNNSQGGVRIGGGKTDSLLSSLDMGHPLETINWFDAFLGGQGQTGDDNGGNPINLDDCDPAVTSALSVPSDTICGQAMMDWFRNKTGVDGISAAFVAGNAKLMSTGINNPNFAIDQISGGSIATPDFNGPEWDPRSIGTMHLIGQYFVEQANPLGASHSQVRLKRLSCNFFDCSNIGNGAQGGNNNNLANGAACNGGHECQSGFCDFTGGNPGVCASPPGHTQNMSCTWSGSYNGTTPDAGCNHAYPICLMSGTQCSDGQPGAPCSTGPDCLSISCNYSTFSCN